MAEVSITVNANDYVVACADGEETHLREIAARVDKEIAGLAESVGQIGEARLLVMVSLLLADKLDDAAHSPNSGEDSVVFLKDADDAEQSAEATSAMHAMATRLENLAASIKKT